MKKKLIFMCCFIMFVLLLVPKTVFALENDFKLISEVTKYYRVETNLYNDTVSFEISKEEYNAADTSIKLLRSDSTVIETTYKSMTSSIFTNGNFYRYQNVLNWKKMPSCRSYDIIGIGFLQSVKVKSNTIYFEQYYCHSDGSCYTSKTNYPQIFVSGAGTSFKLPTGNLTTLRQTFYFDVEKNTNNMIYSQYAYGDYAHATSTVSLLNSTSYSVVQSGGIFLNSSVANNYDTITNAVASWSGSW